MESYEEEWLADQPVLLAILHCVGLFDRPASGDCLRALRAKPSIPGLTDALVVLSDDQWRRAIARLREVRLIAPVDPSDPGALDAHPLVREWFGERLKATNEAAWKEAHSRLYDHLRDTTNEGETPTLADLAPLYHAIAHGCRAGRHQEALDEVYKSRISRRRTDAKLEFYADFKLGAFGSGLTAIFWFFEKPYETPIAALTLKDRSWVLNEASLGLRAQGRLVEALLADRASLQMDEATQDWKNAAISASNLSETELLLGEVAAAEAKAEQSVALADRAGKDIWMRVSRTTHADALHAAGKWERAAKLFADAERRQRKQQPSYPLLHSMRGYQYCDLLLSQRRAAHVLVRATQTIAIARRSNLVLDIALDTLTLGRAHLALALLTLWNVSSVKSSFSRSLAC